MITPITMKYLISLILVIPSLGFTPQTQRRHSNTINKYADGGQSKFSRSYANLADPPTDTKQSFENRMRNLVLKPVKDKAPSTSIPAHPSVHRVTSLQDYKRAVADSGKLTVVRFYADYCRACRAMTPSFYRLASRSEVDDVQWVEVPVTPETAAIHKGLDVPSVPFGHIYHPTAGLVEELRLRKEFLSDFSQILESYRDGQCDLPDKPNPETGIYDSPYERRV